MSRGINDVFDSDMMRFREIPLAVIPHKKLSQNSLPLCQAQRVWVPPLQVSFHLT